MPGGATTFYPSLKIDWERLRHVADLMIAAAGLDLLMVFIHRSDLTSVGLSLWLYCFHLALFGLVGLLMYWLQRKAVTSRAPEQVS